MEETDKQKENTKEKELVSFEWQAPEFEKHEKGIGWFITAGVLALIIFTIALLMENFIFAFLIILAVFAIFIYALKEPRMIKFKIGSRGITIEQTLYTYEDLRSFWLFYDPPQLQELAIKSKKWLFPLITIPLAGENPIEIRKTLLRFLPEKKEEESLIDALTKYLRF